uniref:ABC1 atypical kinase-like domain-containing protein n=1 Tax=viral metagenome TaxID=1070528 RepID=A0A6C0HLY7_9ZZZZ
MQIIKFIVNTATHVIKLYKIKQILNSIEKCKNIDVTSFELNTIAAKTAAKDYTVKLQKLKQEMFDCGFLYVKFFQWYISKLKSDIIQSNISEQKNYSNSRITSISYFISHFEDIFEQCPYHSLEDTKHIFQDMLPDTKIEDYIDINTLCIIASGSIGQVYYAKTTDGKEIAIKVKHPGIDDELKEQVNLIALIQYLQSFKYFRKRFNLFFNIDDFLTDLTLQCDFNNEANNTKKFIENFADSAKYVKFPEVLFSSRDLLISEYIEAHSIDSLTEFQKSQATLTFICFFYQMLFIDNHIHGDLHCKNWKVRLNSNVSIDSGLQHNSQHNPQHKPQIVVYDSGICYSNLNVELTKEFWLALGKYDIVTLSRTIRQFIISSKYEINMNDLESEILVILKELESNFISTQLILSTIVNFFASHDIIIHKFLLNLTITICLIEEFLKKANIINKDKDILKTTNMYNLINESQLDIIAFSKCNNSFKQIGEMLENDMDNKFKKYTENIANNNIDLSIDLNCANNSANIMQSESVTSTIECKLFHTLSTTKLKFTSPE